MYITAQDLYSEFGQTNIDAMADLSTTSLASAIAEAEEQFHDALRGGEYTLPVSASATVKRIVKGLALEILFNARPEKDDNDVKMYKTRIQRSYDLLTQIQTGAIKLDSMKKTDQYPSGPVIVE